MPLSLVYNVGRYRPNIASRLTFSDSTGLIGEVQKGDSLITVNIDFVCHVPL